MHAKLSRLITRRSHYAALIFLPADDHRLATQFWFRKQLYGNEKRIHVDVQNRRGQIRNRRTLRAPILSASYLRMLGPKSRQPSHLLSSPQIQLYEGTQVVARCEEQPYGQR